MRSREIPTPIKETHLQSLLFTAAEHKAAGVLLLPGSRGTHEHYMDIAEHIALNAGVTCMVPSYVSEEDIHGEHIEGITVDDLFGVAVAAYDQLSEQQNVDPKRIGVAGVSFGGRLAIRLTQQRSPESLLLRAPSTAEELPDLPEPETITQVNKIRHIGVISKALGKIARPTALYEIIEKDAKSENKRTRIGAYLPQEGLLRAIYNFSGPITVVESGKDELIPHKAIEACLTVARQANYRVIEGASHVLKDHERELFKGILVEWAKRL